MLRMIVGCLLWCGMFAKPDQSAYAGSEAAKEKRQTARNAFRRIRRRWERKALKWHRDACRYWERKWQWDACRLRAAAACAGGGNGGQGSRTEHARKKSPHARCRIVGGRRLRRTRTGRKPVEGPTPEQKAIEEWQAALDKATRAQNAVMAEGSFHRGVHSEVGGSAMRNGPIDRKRRSGGKVACSLLRRLGLCCAVYRTFAVLVLRPIATEDRVCACAV